MKEENEAKTNVSTILLVVAIIATIFSLIMYSIKFKIKKEM